MVADRRVRILARLLPGADGALDAEWLGQVCRDVTAVTGAGIMLLSDDAPRYSVCTTDAVSARLAELQYLLGEGPGIDAYLHNRPVLEPDLTNPSTSRWIVFAPAAVEVGVQAIFSFPVHVGSARLGAINLYSDSPGPLSDEQHADAMVMADVAAETLLLMQAEAPAGALAAELRGGADLHYVVHQASGMVSVQMGVPIARALILMRAYAFGHERRLTEVAEEVILRQLRFDDLVD